MAELGQTPAGRGPGSPSPRPSGALPSQNPLSLCLPWSRPSHSVGCCGGPAVESLEGRQNPHFPAAWLGDLSQLAPLPGPFGL